MPASALIRTRIAPTPSGYLHVGNAWSFVLTWLLARSQGGTIHLRIDDLDTARFREAYLEDIFASLDWLGLEYDSGPKSSVEFHADFSQRLRREKYRQALRMLLDKELVGDSSLFACQCSREKVKRDSQVAGHARIYSGCCRLLNLPKIPAKLWQSGKGIESAQSRNALRLRLPYETKVTLATPIGFTNPQSFLNPGLDVGDFVVWQKNGEPAYQLASVVDDEELHINYVVRGQDLLASTGAQIYLSGLLGAKSFASAQFLHHGLILGLNGQKLSKSSGVLPLENSVTLKFLRQIPGMREKLFGYFAECLGLPAHIQTLSELLAQFRIDQIPSGNIFWGDNPLKIQTN